MKLKHLLVILLAFLGLFVFVHVSFAKTVVYYPAVSASPSPTPTPQAAVNSFELFWPMAPGKTMTDSLYSLKILKEKISGFFIFGVPEKADYRLFQATKRALEAEKLLADGNQDLARKTLDDMNSSLNQGYDLWQSAKDKGAGTGSVKDSIAAKLSKLEAFYKYMAGKNQGEVKSKLDQATEKIHSFQYSLSL